MESRAARGKLIAIGGGDIKEGNAPVPKGCVRPARGAQSRVAVMTVAADSEGPRRAKNRAGEAAPERAKGKR